MLKSYCNICGKETLKPVEDICEDCKKAILLVKDNYDIIKSFIDTLKQPIVTNNPYINRTPSADNYFIPVSQIPKSSIENVSEISFYDSKNFNDDINK